MRPKHKAQLTIHMPPEDHERLMRFASRNGASELARRYIREGP